MFQIDNNRSFEPEDNIPYSITFCDDGRMVLDVLLPEDERLMVGNIWTPQELVILIMNAKRHLNVNYPDFNFEGM